MKHLLLAMMFTILNLVEKEDGLIFQNHQSQKLVNNVGRICQSNSVDILLKLRMKLQKVEYILLMNVNEFQMDLKLFMLMTLQRRECLAKLILMNLDRK